MIFAAQRFALANHSCTAGWKNTAKFAAPTRFVRRTRVYKPTAFAQSSKKVRISSSAFRALARLILFRSCARFNA